MGASYDITGITDAIDWSTPDSVDDQGRRVFSVRCRLPFSAPMVGAASAVPTVARDAQALPLDDAAQALGVTLQPQAQRGLADVGHNGDGEQPARVLPDDGDGIILPDTATGDPGSDDEVQLAEPLVMGIASSTSVDFYGTEMSLRALKLMAVQMLRDGGVVYLPRHNRGSMGAVEWDEVIGRTVHAEVVPAEQVAKAYNEAESQFVLRATIKLYTDEPLAQALVRRVMRGEAIGQSIGGWFTHLQVLQNEDGDVERVIVQGVELDHLAVTRAPANPDSVGIVSLRTVLQGSAQAHRAAALAQRVVDGQAVCTTPTLAQAVQGQLAERHVVEAMDNGDGTMTLVLAIHDDAHDDDTDEADLGRGYKKKRDTTDADLDDQDHGPAGQSLDSTAGTTQDASSDDARRSAPADHVSTSPAPAGAPSEEHAMTEQDLHAMQEALRTAVSEATTPLVERVAALETAAAAPTNPEPAKEPAPVVDDRLAAAERTAADALARAKAAEEALAAANRRPVRVGRSVVPSLPAGPAARGAADGLVERSRTTSPTVAAVAERTMATITDSDQPGTTVTRGQLEGALRSLLVAAEQDGIITDPNHRAAWQ
jgi:hypothetical protein